MDRYELAWAAGFFDGEGWANAVRQGRGDKQRPQARVNQASDAATPEALLRLQAALGGLGKIAGPIRKEGRRDLFSWTVSSRGDVRQVCVALAPWLGPVKRAQFSRTLGEPVTDVIRPGDETWIAWAAGLFDGEGCSALLKHRSHDGYRTPELSVTQSSLVGSPAVLERFQQVVGAGRISGPYTQRGAKQLVFRWKAAASADVEAVLKRLWPYLGSVKRAQAQRLIDTLSLQPALPRGNPAWGANKTHCVNGHEYATARIRPYVSRGKDTTKRDNAQCLACLREYAREQREKKRLRTDGGAQSFSEAAAAYLLK